MIIPKYLTKCNIKDLIKLLYDLNNSLNLKTITKKILITKLNKYILKSLTKQELYHFFYNYKIKFKKYQTKNKLINKICNLYNKPHLYNKISIFYNKIYAIKKQNNYSNFGYLCEYQLCKQFNLKYTSKILLHNDNAQLKIVFNKIKNDLIKLYNIQCITFLGSKNLKTDFICKQNNKKITLSLKSNYNSNVFVCPQTIGQTTTKQLFIYLKKKLKLSNLNIITNNKLKIILYNKLNYIIILYFQNLFCCDYLLWIQKHKNNNIIYKILSKTQFLNKFKQLKLNNFKYTKSLKLWNNYNSIKYNNLIIATIQIHRHRNCIKFRFHMINLLKLLKYH